MLSWFHPTPVVTAPPRSGVTGKPSSCDAAMNAAATGLRSVTSASERTCSGPSPPRVGPAGKRLGALEIGQQVGEAPAFGPTIVRSRVTPLVGEGVDRARPAQHFAARIGDNPAAKPRLWNGRVAPVHLAALKLGPVRRVGDGWQGRWSAGLDEEDAPSPARKPGRQHATGRTGADNRVVVASAKLFGGSDDA